MNLSHDVDVKRCQLVGRSLAALLRRAGGGPAETNELTGGHHNGIAESKLIPIGGGNEALRPIPTLARLGHVNLSSAQSSLATRLTNPAVVPAPSRLGTYCLGCWRPPRDLCSIRVPINRRSQSCGIKREIAEYHIVRSLGIFRRQRTGANPRSPANGVRGDCGRFLRRGEWGV